MLNIAEAWVAAWGAPPTTDWEGKIVCLETDADGSMRVNERWDMVACYAFTLVLSGRITLLYSSHQLTLRPGDLFIYAPGLSLEVVDATADYHGLCTLADKEYTLESLSLRHLSRVAYFTTSVRGQPRLSLSPEDAAHVEALMRMLMRTLYADHRLKSQSLQLNYALLLLEVMNLREGPLDAGPASKRTEEVFQAFLSLLSQHYMQEHSLGFYASRLHISTTYLSRIVRHFTGHSVADHICQMLVMEASWLLRSSELSIAQIADTLHFADASSFSRFFFRMKGKSPRAFREER